MKAETAVAALGAALNEIERGEGHERIRTQAELDARKGDRALEKSTAKCNEINAARAVA